MALRKCPKCELNYLKPGETGEGREQLLARLGSIVAEKLTAPKEIETEPLTEP